MAGRWNGFVADEAGGKNLREVGNPDHRIRVEHDRDRIFVNLSGEDGTGWTVFAVDRSTRTVGVGQARTQREAATDAAAALTTALGDASD